MDESLARTAWNEPFLLTLPSLPVVVLCLWRDPYAAWHLDLLEVAALAGVWVLVAFAVMWRAARLQERRLSWVVPLMFEEVDIEPPGLYRGAPRARRRFADDAAALAIAAEALTCRVRFAAPAAAMLAWLALGLTFAGLSARHALLLLGAAAFPFAASFPRHGAVEASLARTLATRS
jgi:hypothetical protein